MNLKQELESLIEEFQLMAEIQSDNRHELIHEIIKLFEKRIDSKIQNITDLINDDRITTEGWYKAKGMKEAYENVKNMLSNQIN